MSYKVNEHSWHYRFNKFMIRTNKKYTSSLSNADEVLQDEATDFCSYWKLFVRGVFSLIIGLLGLLILASIVISLIIHMFVAWQTALAFFVLVVALMTLSWLVSMLITWVIVVIGKNSHTAEESFIARAYKNWKDKTCERIEYTK